MNGLGDVGGNMRSVIPPYIIKNVTKLNGIPLKNYPEYDLDRYGEIILSEEYKKNLSLKDIKLAQEVLDDIKIHNICYKNVTGEN